jgi:hypothetical protein
VEKYSKANVDSFGDSYTTPMTVAEVQEVSPLSSDLTTQLLADMDTGQIAGQSNGLTLETLLDEDGEATPGRLFARYIVYIDKPSAPENDTVRPQALRFSLQQVVSDIQVLTNCT